MRDILDDLNRFERSQLEEQLRGALAAVEKYEKEVEDLKELVREINIHAASIIGDAGSIEDICDNLRK